MESGSSPETSRSPTKEELLALLQKARFRAKQEISLAEQAEKPIRHTTFVEYLQANHDLITKPMAVRTEQLLASKGYIISPTGHVCPDYLEPFDFREIYQEVFDQIYQIFQSPSPKRLVPPLNA
ncbi:hypothetical protein MW887_006088 [Aspergillus wentii]|nr:hypothetical protein MW887_006088 [Aspergillus wentii]